MQLVTAHALITCKIGCNARPRFQFNDLAYNDLFWLNLETVVRNSFYFSRASDCRTLAWLDSGWIRAKLRRKWKTRQSASTDRHDSGLACTSNADVVVNRLVRSIIRVTLSEWNMLRSRCIFVRSPSSVPSSLAHSKCLALINEVFTAECIRRVRTIPGASQVPWVETAFQVLCINTGTGCGTKYGWVVRAVDVVVIAGNQLHDPRLLQLVSLDMPTATTTAAFCLLGRRHRARNKSTTEASSGCPCTTLCVTPSPHAIMTRTYLRCLSARL